MVTYATDLDAPHSFIMAPHVARRHGQISAFISDISAARVQSRVVIECFPKCMGAILHSDSRLNVAFGPKSALTCAHSRKRKIGPSGRVHVTAPRLDFSRIVSSVLMCTRVNGSTARARIRGIRAVSSERGRRLDGRRFGSYDPTQGDGGGGSARSRSSSVAQRDLQEAASRKGRIPLPRGL